MSMAARCRVAMSSCALSQSQSVIAAAMESDDALMAPPKCWWLASIGVEIQQAYDQVHNIYGIEANTQRVIVKVL